MTVESRMPFLEAAALPKPSHSKWRGWANVGLSFSGVLVLVLTIVLPFAGVRTIDTPSLKGLEAGRQRFIAGVRNLASDAIHLARAKSNNPSADRFGLAGAAPDFFSQERLQLSPRRSLAAGNGFLRAQGGGGIAASQPAGLSTWTTAALAAPAPTRSRKTGAFARQSRYGLADAVDFETTAARGMTPAGRAAPQSRTFLAEASRLKMIADVARLRLAGARAVNSDYVASGLANPPAAPSTRQTPGPDAPAPRPAPTTPHPRVSGPV